MKPREKRSLILDPVMSMYTTKDWIAKSDSLWRICRKEGFAIQITPELSRVGDLHRVCICYGSFYAGVECGGDHVPYMSDMVDLEPEGYPNVTDDVSEVCRMQAEAYIAHLSASPIKELFSAKTHKDYLYWSHIVKEHHPGLNISERRAWDLLACEGREKALCFLDERVSQLEREEPLPTRFINRCEELKRDIISIDPAKVNEILSERYIASENILSLYFGKKRWSKLESEG